MDPDLSSCEASTEDRRLRSSADATRTLSSRSAARSPPWSARAGRRAPDQIPGSPGSRPFSSHLGIPSGRTTPSSPPFRRPCGLHRCRSWCAWPLRALRRRRDEVQPDLGQEVRLVQGLHDGMLQPTSLNPVSQNGKRARTLPRRACHMASTTAQWFGHEHSKGERVEKTGGNPFWRVRSARPRCISRQYSLEKLCPFSSSLIGTARLKFRLAPKSVQSVRSKAKCKRSYERPKSSTSERTRRPGPCSFSWRPWPLPPRSTPPTPLRADALPARSYACRAPTNSVSWSASLAKMFG